MISMHSWSKSTPKFSEYQDNKESIANRALVHHNLSLFCSKYEIGSMEKPTLEYGLKRLIIYSSDCINFKVNNLVPVYVSYTVKIQYYKIFFGKFLRKRKISVWRWNFKSVMLVLGGILGEWWLITQPPLWGFNGDQCNWYTWMG